MILLSVLSVGMNLPFGKIKELLKVLWGLDVSEATISNTLTKPGEFLGEDYAKLKHEIRKASVKYNDETGWRIPGRGSWLWDFISHKVAYYAIEWSGGKKAVKKVLGKKSRGVNANDGLKSYNEYESGKQRCRAHILRRFKQAVHFPFKNKREKQDFRKLKNSLKLMFRRAKADKEKTGVSVKLREKYEKKPSRILAKNTKVRIQRGYWQPSEIRRMNCSPSWSLDMLIQLPIIKRKISYQSRSMKHARNYVMQLSIMKTAELC